MTRKLFSKQIIKNMIKTILIISLATGCSLFIKTLGIDKESIIMLYLLSVLFTSVLTSSYIYGIVASVISLMLFNYLFTEPRFAFVIYSSNDIILLIFFLITAIVSGIVTSRLQEEIELAAKNERTTKILYQIASGFLSVSGKQKIILKGISFIREYVGCTCTVKTDINEDLSGDRNGPDVLQAVRYSIKSSAGQLGVMDILASDLDDRDELIIQAVVTQLGIALDREQLYNEQESIRMAMEKERLRATLLRSVAHDLRSPLTALSGAGNLLADDYDSLSETERKKLASDISEEIIWLTNLVENILHMTRINESQIVIQKQEEVVDDVVSEAVSHISRIFGDHQFEVLLPEEVVTVPMDGRLIVRVLVNLLENAVRHTPPGSRIYLCVEITEKDLVVSIADTGEGIDDSIKDTLFEGFVTMDKNVADGKRGIGLGLAICKAIIDAHGGVIRAESNQPKGARFTFTLPLEDK